MNPMIKAWGIMMVLLLIIAVVSIGLIFSPVQIHSGIITAAPSALTVQGLQLRAEVWKEYPNYTGGLGFIAIAAFAGSTYACHIMYAVHASDKETKEATESKIG